MKGWVFPTYEVGLWAGQGKVGVTPYPGISLLLDQEPAPFWTSASS